MEVKAKKEKGKVEKAATKAKAKEEKEKEKMEKKAEKEVVKMKGKAKQMANTLQQPNPEVTVKPKQLKKDSGTHEAVAAIYSKLQQATTTAANSSRGEQDALASGGSGKREVGNVKG